MVHLSKADFRRGKPCFLWIFELFAPKCDANSYKMQCYLLQNAVLSPTKRGAISCKTQGKMQQNAEQNAMFCRS